MLHDLLADGIDGIPKLQILKSCRNLIRTLPSLPYSETHPEEIDDKSEDHAYDSLTYGLYKIINYTGGELVTPQSLVIDQSRQGFTSNGNMSNEPLVDIRSILENRDNRDWRSI